MHEVMRLKEDLRAKLKHLELPRLITLNLFCMELSKVFEPGKNLSRYEGFYSGMLESFARTCKDTVLASLPNFMFRPSGHIYTMEMGK